jgi:hypothetical protein
VDDAGDKALVSAASCPDLFDQVQSGAGCDAPTFDSIFGEL